MKRTELLDNLKKVSPALATRDFIPIMCCFCFDGKTVTAYDDIVAMGLPMSFGVKGGIRGDVLLGWLSNSKAPEVELEHEGNELKLKAGRSKLKLAVLPKDDFLFEWPKEEEPKLKMTKVLLESFAKCLVSMGSDPSRPWACGITVDFAKGRLKLYSTNNVAASMSRIEMEVPKELVGTTILLPPRFCQLLVDIGGRDTIEWLSVQSSATMAYCKSGLRLLTRNGSESSLKDYQEFFSNDMREESEKLLTDIPSGLESALSRGLVILSHAKDKVSLLEVKDGRLSVESKADVAHVKDVLKMPNHPDTQLQLQSEVLVVAIRHAKKIGFVGGRHAILKGDAFTHLVCAVS